MRFLLLTRYKSQKTLLTPPLSRRRVLLRSGGFGSAFALGADSRVQHCQSRAETVMIWPPVYTNQDAFIARNNTGDRTNDWGNNVVAVKSN